MVTLNRIYTRTGDDGTTALGSGERRPKHDLRISSYGTVDETNASIGVARLHVDPASRLSPMLAAIQNDLFDVGADLAVPDRPGKAERLRIVAVAGGTARSATSTSSMPTSRRSRRLSCRAVMPGRRICMSPARSAGAPNG